MLMGSGLALSGAPAPRPGCGSQHPPRFACVLLAAAPTAPPCFRRWRRSSPLPPKGEPLAGRAALNWTPEAQYGAKGRALLQRPAASGQRTLSSCRCPEQRSTTAHETNKLCSFSGNLTDMPKPPLDRGGGCARGADGEVSSTAASKPDRKMINTKNYQMTSRNIF